MYYAEAEKCFEKANDWETAFLDWLGLLQVGFDSVRLGLVRCGPVWVGWKAWIWGEICRKILFWLLEGKFKQTRFENVSEAEDEDEDENIGFFLVVGIRIHTMYMS